MSDFESGRRRYREEEKDHEQWDRGYRNREGDEREFHREVRGRRESGGEEGAYNARFYSPETPRHGYGEPRVPRNPGFRGLRSGQYGRARYRDRFGPDYGGEDQPQDYPDVREGGQRGYEREQPEVDWHRRTTDWEYGRHAGRGEAYTGQEPRHEEPIKTTYGFYHPEREEYGSAGPYYGVGPEGYHRSDERIREEVCERMTRHGDLDAHRIRVEVKDGEVILSGSVDSRRSKRLAEALADAVRGVEDVNNQLRIQPEDEQAE